MQNQKSPPELPNSWRTGHAPLMSLLIIARTLLGPGGRYFYKVFKRLNSSFLAFEHLLCRQRPSNRRYPGLSWVILG